MALNVGLVIPFLVAAMLTCTPLVAVDATDLPADTAKFLEAHCYDCHAGDTAEAGLDLAALSKDASNDDIISKWTRVFDRVHDGEMPPKDAEPLSQQQRDGFARQLGDWIRHKQDRDFVTHGRVRARRLTNLQLERTLHDLLGIDIPLANRMPDEPRVDGFNTVAAGQSISHFQLEQHVAIVDVALDEAFRRALTKPDEWERHLPAKEIVRRRARSRTREPEMLDDHAVVWSGGVIFYGRVPATMAREDGWYRFTIRAKALKQPADHGVWCTVRSGRCVSSAPMLAWVGAFEAQAEPKEVTYDAWLSKGDMLEIRPGDATLKKARFAGGQIGTGEGGPQNVPGVAIEWIKMQRIHRGPADWGVRSLLFDDLEIDRSKRQVTTADPQRDAARLIRRFARLAFRRPVDEAVVKPYVELTTQALANGEEFVSAVRAGYRALLCSPRFLYFQEQPGELDDFAIASRLSYLLWSRMPDSELFRLARDAKLRQPSVLAAQVDRMLKDPRGKDFVSDFASQWLDLSLIDFTEPDRKLYPGFDIIVQQSMLDETHAYLQKMLDEDLSVSHLIDSDFTFLNSRLARFYDIDRVDGDTLRQVSLKREHHRSGLLTHGSIMKVTANGTTTSPVIRGVWVSERLLGTEIPPPPESVPAIEPDIRGAKTIREMLAKHKADAACAICHVKIDPPGFALENYDPAGRWRDRYLQVSRGRGKPGLAIDASFEMPDGRAFQDVREFQQLVLADKQKLARNVAEKLLTYGTGAAIQFADREHVERIASETKSSDYGFRSVLKAVVVSPVFLSK